MRHLGDFDTSTVVYGKFTTFRPSTGAAFTLGGTPVLSVYKDNSATQSTTGVTLSADFDTTTGLNHFEIDTSADGTFYSSGSFFDVVITTGTIDSISVVGAVVGSFTLRKNSALKPTTAGRALDVSAGGEAGVDWANVGSPTTSLNLSGTTIAVTQKVDLETIKTNPVVNGGTITFPTGATLASTTNITAGTITTATNVTTVNGLAGNVITAAATAADFTTEIQTGLATAAALATVDGIVDDILLDTAEIGTAGAGLTNINLPNQTMDIAGNITGNLSGSVGSVTGNVGGNVTGSTGSLAAQAKADVNAEVLDVLSVDTFAEPTGVPAATTTLAGKIGRIYQALRNKVEVTATKKTFYDDADAALWEKDLSDDSTTYTETEGNAP